MNPFRPLPWLSNPHVQTVLANLLNGLQGAPRARQRLVPLADGDRVVLHETPPSHVGDDCPIAVLLHGLGGSAASAYMTRMTARLSAAGWRVFRMDLRGAGAGVSFARRLYSAACSHDVRAVVDHLAEAYPAAPVAVVGFSLGGNIVLKFAGEIGAAAVPPRNVHAVAAVAPPIDLVRCSDLLARYPFYDAFFVRNLMRQARQHHKHFRDLPRVAFARRPTLRQFDDLYTAPRWGYAGALDYYRQASALTRMAAIRLPTFILTARDDPFVAVEPIEGLPASPVIEVHVSAHGGHLGHLGRDEAGGIRWSETQVINWLRKQIR
jgi:predicted alpha/beta-fold hydrolase